MIVLAELVRMTSDEPARSLDIWQESLYFYKLSFSMPIKGIVNALKGIA